MPWAVVAGDIYQPALQVTYQKSPEKKVTIQENIKQGTVVIKGRCGVVEQHIDELLAFLGPVTKVIPQSKWKAPKEVSSNRSIRDWIVASTGGH